MNMLRTVVKVQWTILKRDKTLWVLLAAFVALLVYTGVGGVTQTNVELERIDSAQADEATRLSHIKTTLERDPPPPGVRTAPGSSESEPYIVGNDLGRRVATLPPSPLALITKEGPAARPNLLEVTLGHQLKDPDQASRPVSAGRTSLGGVDMAFVLLYLLPLLIIAVSYDLLLGEREQKTLAIVLSQPVSVTTFILGKMLARALLVGLATLVPVLAFWLVAAPVWSGDGIVSVLLGVAVILSYTAFWMAAALAANAWMRSSAASALALMGLWLVCLVLAPGLIRIGVETLYRPPSRVKLVNLSRQAAQEAESALTSIEGNHGEKATKDYQRFLDSKIEAHEHMEDALHQVLADFDTQLERQQDLVGWLQMLSPAVVVRESFADLAGDGVHRHQDFKRQVEAYHEAYQAYFFDKVKKRQHLRAEDLDTIPTFTLEPQPPTAQLKRVGIGVFGILVPTVGLVLLSVGRVRRIGRL